MKLDTSSIDERARSISLVRVLLTIVAAFFFSIGYVARILFAIGGLVLRWSIAAVQIGWESRRERET